MKSENRVLGGEITSAHGIRGFVKVYPYTDTPERLTEIRRVFLGEEEDLREVLSSSIQKNLALMQFEGIETRNQAERLRKTSVYIPLEDRRVPEDDEFFIEDLIGLPVTDTDGRALGEVAEVLLQSANDVLVVRDADKEIMIPFVKAFVKTVEATGITVALIGGMEA